MLSPEEQAMVDQHVATNGLRRCALDPGRDPKRLTNLFWKKRYKTASAARARVLADDLAQRDHAQEAD